MNPNTVDMDMALRNPVQRAMYERTPQSKIQNRFTKMYRPKALNGQATSAMTQKIREEGDYMQVEYQTEQEYDFLSASFLEYELDDMTVKPEHAETHQIRVVGDFHQTVHEAKLIIGNHFFTQPRVVLDLGFGVPRDKQDDYKRFILRSSALRTWSTHIPGDTFPVPQTWPYCRENSEALPLFMGARVVHKYTFDLAIDKLVQMRRLKNNGKKGVRAKGKKDNDDGDDGDIEWEIIPFDFTVIRGLGGKRHLKCPQLWGHYDKCQPNEKKAYIERGEIYKRYQDYTVLPSTNPVNAGEIFPRSLALTKDLPSGKFSFAAERFNSPLLAKRKKDDNGVDQSFIAESPDLRYMTESGEKPITYYTLEYGDEKRIAKTPFSHCEMQRYFKLSSSPLTRGMGTHSQSYDDGDDGTGGTISLKDKSATLKINIAPTSQKQDAKYIVYVIVSTLKMLRFTPKGCELMTLDNQEKNDMSESVNSTFSESRFM